MSPPPRLPDPPHPIKLSSDCLRESWLAKGHEWMWGETMSACVWCGEHLLFRNRAGEFQILLRDISSFWRVEDRIFEVQAEHRRSPVWRFVFVVGFEHGLRPRVIETLANAIRQENPTASIVPLPGQIAVKRPWFGG